VLLAEADVGAERRDAVGDGEAVVQLELAQHPGVVVPGALVALRDLLGQRHGVCERSSCLAKGRRAPGPRFGFGQLALLVEHADRGVLGQRHRPSIGLDHAAQDAQERVFPAPFGATQRHPLPSCTDIRHVLEELVAREAEGDVVGSQQNQGGRN